MHFSLFPRMLANVGYHACGSVVSHSQNAVLPQPREGRGQRPEVLSGVLELAARPSSRWSPSHRGWPCGPDVSGGLCGGGMQSVQGRANGERPPSGRACAAGEECEFGMLGGREAQTSTHTHRNLCRSLGRVETHWGRGQVAGPVGHAPRLAPGAGAHGPANMEGGLSRESAPASAYTCLLSLGPVPPPPEHAA